MNAQFISLFLPITAKPIVVANPFANLLSVCTTKKLPLLVGTLFCKKKLYLTNVDIAYFDAELIYVDF